MGVGIGRHFNCQSCSIRALLHNGQKPLGGGSKCCESSEVELAMLVSLANFGRQEGLHLYNACTLLACATKKNSV
jgi:hypothetical protein